MVSFTLRSRFPHYAPQSYESTKFSQTYSQISEPVLLCTLGASNDYGNVDAVKTPLPLRGLLCTLGIIDSCNGLLCIASKRGPSYKDTNILVWNPSTGDSKLLPNPNPSLDFHNHPVGFAYDSSVDDYKILRFADRNFEVYMYTLRTNSWKSIGYAPSLAGGMSKQGRFRDECIFWLHRGRSRVENVYKIFCFDWRDEIFKVLPLPHELQQGEVTDLRVLGEYLGIIQLSTEYQLWIMKHDKKKEWIKIISMHFDRVEFWVKWMRPVCITKNGEVVILARFNGSDQLKSMLYDPKRSSIEEFPIHGFAGINIYEEIKYIESFVSPNFGQKD